MSQSIDYKRLGETTGKAWRLGHPQAGKSEIEYEATKAAKRMRATMEATFKRGFLSGVAAVDKERAKAK